MNRFIFTAIVIFWGSLFQIPKAQQVTTEWVINNFSGFPVGVMIGIDNNGDVIVTGHSGDFTKIITTKYDSAGNLVWEKFYSVPNLGVAATWLSIDLSGNIIITGYPRTFSTNPVQSGLLTLKYDNNGNLLWDKLIPGTWAFAVQSVIDNSGNIYITGRAWQYTGTYDFVTVKYAPDGTQLWLDTFDQSGGFHTPSFMELDNSNNLFITGGGLSGGLITTMYDSSGVRKWVKEEPGTPGQSIRVDNNGGIFITGSYYDVSTGTSNDIRLIKYDYSGNLIWQKFYDFGSAEFGKLINIDPGANIFISGYGTLPGGSYIGWIIAKMDTDGNLLWHKRLKENYSWDEFPYFALTGPQNEIYVTGNVGLNITGTTYHGLATLRYNSNGDIAWIAEFNLYAGIGKGLALDDNLNLYAVGQFYYSVIKYSQQIPSGIGEISDITPDNFSLGQNYPNPFNPVTKINFSIPQTSNVELKVTDILGNQVAILVKEAKEKGVYTVTFDGSGLASGMYLYHIKADSFTETKKMLLVR